MKTVYLTLLIILTGLSGLKAQLPTAFVPISYEEADRKADSLLQLMTMKEKLNYIGGSRLFYTQAVRRLGIPAVPFVDATQGIRLNPAIINPGMKRPAKKTVAYPAPILLAATWNSSMAFRYGNSIGTECRAAGLPLLLGPGLNLYRNSQCGRNFEYFGEDPFLAGSLVASYVSGLQETGTIATLKHFLANQTDYYRRRSNSVVDERTLQEIYMPAFRQGVDAGARAVMTSYNLVNGEWAGESDYVINHLLREELDFRWLVMTDWFSVWDGKKLIHSGQDLEMPFSKATRHADKLLAEGAIEEEDIDRMVRNILRTFISMNSFSMEKDPLSEADYAQLEEVALNTAREGIVLLRNERQLLPVDTTGHRQILVTGSYYDQWISGRGAGFVKGFNRITLQDALEEQFGDRLIFTKKPSAGQLAKAEIVFLSVGTEDGEGYDRPYDLPSEQEELVQFCAAHNPNTVVIVTSGSGINMSGWKDIPAILYTWYPGQNGATAVAEILAGRTNPSGKLPISMERSFDDSPAFGYIPKGEELYTGFKMRAELKRDVYDVHYGEGIFMGYRWYDTRAIEPQFCFGHGLSYTTFEYTDMEVTPASFSAGDTVVVSLTVKNIGSTAGSEVIQLYVRDPESSVPRPEKELKGFRKLFLDPGASERITIELTAPDFQFWHPERKEWTLEEGIIEILIGASSRDIRMRKTILVL